MQNIKTMLGFTMQQLEQNIGRLQSELAKARGHGEAASNTVYMVLVENTGSVEAILGGMAVQQADGSWKAAQLPDGPGENHMASPIRDIPKRIYEGCGMKPTIAPNDSPNEIASNPMIYAKDIGSDSTALQSVADKCVQAIVAEIKAVNATAISRVIIVSADEWDQKGQLMVGWSIYLHYK